MAALKLAACSLGGRFAVPSAQLARFPTGRSEEGWPERQRQRERERERERERGRERKGGLARDGDRRARERGRETEGERGRERDRERDRERGGQRWLEAEKRFGARPPVSATTDMGQMLL